MSVSQKLSRHQNAVLTIVLMSYLMIILDVSVVLTGLPKIHQEFAFSEAELSWVQSAYTLAFGGLLLLGAEPGLVQAEPLVLAAAHYFGVHCKCAEID